MSASVETKRHSLAHVLAQAVQELYPDAKKAIGPDIENGFYFDFDFGDFELKEEHLRDIEKKMKNILKQNQKFERYEMSVAEAIAKAKNVEKNPYKVEIIEDLVAKEGITTVSYYRNVTQQGVETYEDLCRGPHVEKLSEIDEQSFALDRIAGAYWRGDSERTMLTRIYGLAFDTRDELDAYRKQREEAAKRDHRVLGRKLKLFTLSDLVGSGLPLLQPNGMIVRREVEEYLWNLHKDRGYLRVWTPHLAKEDLYVTSGHAGHYLEDMFVVHGGTSKEKFHLKPMNCPHHMQLFADNQFSYRDMPIRYFEPATVYRDEKTGQLSGLTRVRAITQDDGHLFCRVSQIREEVSSIVSIIKEFYTTFGLMEGYWVSLSVRGEDRSKYLGSDDVWNLAEGALEEAAQANGLNYRRVEGEAAFYGPKLDFMFKDAIGREWQLATIQCDFNLPNRFDLSFVNEQGEREQPVVIHRAISGSLERFMGIMIEHFAGRFPLWISPEQVRVVPVGEAFFDYGREVLSVLRAVGMRASIDDSTDNLGKKIRNGEQAHVPYLLVVGEKEMNARTVAVRDVRSGNQADESLDAIVSKLVTERENKSLSSLLA
ncbi:MAG TPA: threonine--tRNA ligase [bacterium]|nr:threonine--tRNA ligase [bacterium]